MSSNNWLQSVIKQAATVSDIEELESWNSWAQAASDLDFNTLRTILGNITTHLNEISLIFKQGVRGGSQQTTQRAIELIPDIQNTERLHQAANQAYTILSTKTTGNPQEVMLKNMLHSVVRMNFTPQQKSAFSEITQGNMAQTQFAEEVNAEKLNQFLQTSIYSVKDPEQKTLKVFREVLQNAADAAMQQHTVDPSQPPSVSINTQEYQDDKGKYMDLMIQDNGIGMNWETLSQKFFVYFQSGKENTEATGGFGIAKAVIQETPEHGWSIDSNGIHASRFSKNVYMGEREPGAYQPAQSEVQPGRGTTLNLYHLPAAGTYSMSDLARKYASETLKIQLNGNLIEPLFKLSELTTVEGDLSGIVDAISESDAEKNVATDVINKESGPEPLGRMTYPQTTVDFHIRKISYSGRFYVLLNGQYQYDVHEYIPKAEIICSVQTTARPGSEEYPMDPGRDNLRSPYKEDVARTVSKLKEMFTKIAESEIFKDGLDITIYNKDKPAIGMREEDRSEEEWQKRRILERALEGSVGGQSGIYGEPNAPSTLRGSVADAEELAKALQDNVSAIASDRRQESIVSAAVESLMQERGDKIDVQKEMDKIITGLMTPAGIIIQKNFVSPNIAHDNPDITANLIILWQEILKTLTDSFGDYFKSYRSTDYIPGLVYSNECVALYNRTKQVDYAMISINPMIVASILHTGAFEKWVNNNESASGEFEEAYSSMNDTTPINRIASLLFHSAVHELTHLYYPDSYEHSNFHNNITRLESKAHFMFKPIRDLVKKHMTGLKRDMMNLIRVVRDDRKQRDSAKSMMMPLRASALITRFHRAMKKVADLNGEWWIIDGFSEYADRDIGDTNHDGVVYSHLFGIINDIMVDDDIVNLIDMGNLNEEQMERIEELYPGLISQFNGNYEAYDQENAKWERVVDGMFNVEEQEEIELQWPGYLRYSGMPKDYAVEHLGWIRVTGSNFEVQKVNDNSLSSIIEHSLEQSDDEEEEICINEFSTGAYLCFDVDELKEAVTVGQGEAKFRMRQRSEVSELY